GSTSPSTTRATASRTARSSAESASSSLYSASTPFRSMSPPRGPSERQHALHLLQELEPPRHHRARPILEGGRLLEHPLQRETLHRTVPGGRAARQSCVPGHHLVGGA